MKKMVLACLLCISSICFAGDWSRDSENTISFSGPINADEFDKFQAVYDSKVSRIVVNSPGGDVAAGVMIGNVIFDHKIGIVVRGVCISSCANYLFTAGHKKIIDSGIVGFHGDWAAWIQTPDFTAGLNSFPENQRSEKRDSVLHTVAEETKFLKKIGVSQKLFDRTQKDDKGMNDGKVYDLLLPKPETFEKYGIKNVIGTQDLEMFMALYPTAVVIED